MGFSLDREHERRAFVMGFSLDREHEKPIVLNRRGHSFIGAAFFYSSSVKAARSNSNTRLHPLWRTNIVIDLSILRTPTHRSPLVYG
jgi:hypothetical protein